MTVASAQITPFVLSDHFGAGSSDDAKMIREAQGNAFLDLQRGRALPPYMALLSPEARVAVDARWSDVSEAMFEFLAANYPSESAQADLRQRPLAAGDDLRGRDRWPDFARPSGSHGAPAVARSLEPAGAGGCDLRPATTRRCDRGWEAKNHRHE